MKNSHPLLLSRPLVIFSLVVGFVLAAGTAILSTVSTREVAAASIRSSDTQDTLLQINQLLASLVDAETGQRGYILTGLESYLEPYTRAGTRLDMQLARLTRRFENTPTQQATLDQIKRLVDEKKSEMKRTIELRRSNAPGSALHLVDSGAGLNTMNAIRDAVHKLEENELTELAANSAAVSRRATFFQRTGLSMLIAACVLGGAGAHLLMRRVNELEAIITVCAWTKRVKFNGAWVSFEEYLHARFHLRFTHGISEEAAAKLQMEATPPPAELNDASKAKPRPGISYIPPSTGTTTHQPTIKHA
jgi:CHASE3 domain sensor protein